MKYIYFITLIALIIWYKFLGQILLLFLSKKKTPGSIAYLCAFHEENAGFNWRVKKWADILKKEGFKVKMFISMNKEDFHTLQTEEQTNELSKLLIRNLKLRFWQVIACRSYETIIVRREILIYNDYDNLFLEKLVLKLNNKAILDFDDAIGVSKENNTTKNKLIKILFLPNTNKFNKSLNIYNNFIVASDYLKNRVIKKTKQNVNICVIPTCVDYDKFPRKKYTSNISTLNIGWVGSNNNMKELYEVVDVFNELSKTYNLKLTIISGKPLNIKTNFKINFVNWSLENEVEEILKIDVGIMPLKNNEVTKGKGGFKLIQYMGLGIVSVASPITINKKIVDHKKDSFLAKEKNDWENIFIKIFEKKINLDDVGRNAFLKIKNHFSFNSNKNKYLKFIKSI